MDGHSLGKLLEDVETGKIQLPDFQRQWKWDDDRIRALLATVTLDYPLGVAMTLETGGEAKFKARPLHGTTISSSIVPEQLLLDGQQRLTSLFQALKSQRPVETIGPRNKQLRCLYYIDISKAIDNESDRDDAILSVPENRSVRGVLGRGTADLATREKECQYGLFPLNLIFDPEQTGKWQRIYVGGSDDRWALWSAFAAKVIDTVKGFQVPLIRLPKETQKEAVCSVFERVNTGGVVLNVFELLTATYAGDADYARAHGEDFSLRQSWRTIKANLCSKYLVFGSVDQDTGYETGLTNLDFLQAIALVRTYYRKQRFLAENPSATNPPAVSCKRRDLLNLPLTDYSELAPKMAESFSWVGRFLSTQCVFRERDLPYGSQLVPLAAIGVILGNAVEDPEVHEKLARWYWCGVLGELYGGITDTRFVRDVEQVILWIRDSGPEPDTIMEATFQEQRLHRLTSRNSAAYKGIYALLIKQNPLDWYFNEGPITEQTLIGQYVDIRQVFPRAQMERGSIDSGRVSSIVNKTPLSHRAQQTIGSNKPSIYLHAFERETGTPPDWFNDIVGTHLIDAKTLRADDFEVFYRDRTERLLGLVELEMGKAVVREGTSDER